MIKFLSEIENIFSSILTPSIAPVCRRRTDCRAGEFYIGVMSQWLAQWEQTRSLPEETSLPF